MKALLNFSDHHYEWPRKVTIPAATTTTIRGVVTRTPGVVVVSDDLAAAMQAHDVMRGWVGPFGIVIAPVVEVT